MRLEGKTAVVTGGSSGIGLATAKRLRAEGARVAISARDSGRLADAAAAIGDDTLCVAADVSRVADVERLFQLAADRLGAIDVVFINAGVGKLARIAEVTEAMFDEVFSINTKGAYFTMQKALPFLNDGASIIFNALAPVSPAWRRPGTTLYTASKVALLSFVHTSAAELAERGIRVNAVSPGPIVTPIYDHFGLPADMIEARRGQIAAEVPLKRLGAPEEIAAVVAFLASDEASFITGTEVRADGGIG
jgi:NAD(P)-dependent dehydrogenase (short-subunit alcohol dehydrogenase family)